MFRKKRTQKYKVIGSKPKKIVVSLLTSTIQERGWSKRKFIKWRTFNGTNRFRPTECVGLALCEYLLRILNMLGNPAGQFDKLFDGQLLGAGREEWMLGSAKLTEDSA